MTNAPSQPFPALPRVHPKPRTEAAATWKPGSSPKATTQNTSLSFTSHPPLITSLSPSLIHPIIARHGFLRRLVSPPPPTARKASTRNREPAATATATLQLLQLPAFLALFRKNKQKDRITDRSLHTAASSTSSPVSSWSSAVSASSSTLECEPTAYERSLPLEEAL